MAAVTIRNLPDEIHRALKRQAARHGRSTEAEIRHILEEAVRPAQHTLIGTALTQFGAQWGGVDIDPTAWDEIEPADFA